MKILLADDHTLFRDALVQFIERAEPDSTVLLARDMHEVMEILDGAPELDLILLDFRMPGMEGLKGLEKLRSAYPDMPVALLSGIAERSHVEQALKMGASGFFPKTMSGKAMISGVKKIIEGEQFIAYDHNNHDIMPSYYNGGPHGLHDNAQAALENDESLNLTPREKEVLSYLAKGATNKDIAQSLDLQIVTVKLHVRGICRKLGVKNRTQAALKAQQFGLE